MPKEVKEIFYSDAAKQGEQIEQQNPEFTEQIDENALIEQARQEFFEECKKNGLNITE